MDLLDFVASLKLSQNKGFYVMPKGATQIFRTTPSPTLCPPCPFASSENSCIFLHFFHGLQLGIKSALHRCHWTAQDHLTGWWVYTACEYQGWFYFSGGWHKGKDALNSWILWILCDGLVPFSFSLHKSRELSASSSCTTNTTHAHRITHPLFFLSAAVIHLLFLLGKSYHETVFLLTWRR